VLEVRGFADGLQELPLRGAGQGKMLHLQEVSSADELLTTVAEQRIEWADLKGRTTTSLKQMAKKANKGKRYSEEERAEIVQFITDFDKKNGRGGMKNASEKYGVSTVSIARWQNGAGKKKRKYTKRAKAPKTTTAAVGASADAPRGRKPAIQGATATLTRMVQIHEQIGALESEYDTLKQSL